MMATEKDYPDVSRFDVFDLFSSIKTTEIAIKWAMTQGLLGSSRVCLCQTPMTLIATHEVEDSNNNANGDGFVWQCPNQQCGSTQSVRHGSFYDKINMPLVQCIQLTYYWSFNDVSHLAIEDLLGLSCKHHTLRNWLNMHRDLCTRWMRDHPLQIGGPGHVVIISEILVPLFERGRDGQTNPTKESWVFGGVDEKTRETFLVEVTQKDAATLLPIIKKHVLPETTIWSSRWAEYEGLTAVAAGSPRAATEYPFSFVAPARRRAAGIGVIWRSVKEKFKHLHETFDIFTAAFLAEPMLHCESEEPVTSYLDQFLWHRMAEKKSKKRYNFHRALQLIRAYHPV